jgi:hypothetical protein
MEKPNTAAAAPSAAAAVEQGFGQVRKQQQHRGTAQGSVLERLLDGLDL